MRHSLGPLPLVRLVLLAVLGLASALWPKLGLPAAFLVMIGWIALVPATGAGRRSARLVLLLASLGAAVGTARFVVVEAVPGIIAGGQRATSQAAVSQLRTLLFAEDALRQHAQHDPDHDGVGSAALLGELCGTQPLRGGARLDPAVVEVRPSALVETPIGTAMFRSGYLFIVCLPRPDGGWTARAGDPVDDERAERRFVAYAWPASNREGVRQAYFLDEHEMILVSPNGDEADPRWAGQSFPPPCDAAFVEPTKEEWKAWQGKKSRASLPGAQ